MMAEIISGMSEQLEDLASAPLQGWQVAVYALCLLIGIVVDIVLLARVRAGSHALRLFPAGWQAKTAWLRERPWRWRETSILLLVFLAIHLAFFLLTALAKHGFAIPLFGQWCASALGQGIISQSVVLATVAVIMFGCKTTLAAAFGFHGSRLLRDIGFGILGFFAILPAVACVALLVHLFLWLLNMPVETQPAIQIFLTEQTAGILFFWLFLAVVLAPLVEEVLFRGILLPVLTQKIKILPALALTALIFAAAHFHLPTLLPLFVLALGLGLAYILSGSLLPSIVMHVLFNALNLLLLWSQIKL